MSHTILLQEGFWVAEGEYYDGNGNGYSAVAQWETTRRAEIWVTERIMKVFFDEPVAVADLCEVEPLEKGRNSTRWTSRNRILGPLKGRLVLVGGSIVSLSRSEDGRYSGTEWLHRSGEKTYRDRGVLLEGDRVLASWAMEVRKIEGS